ncbi:MAG: 16S rRNA (uracil(1498)-N(3))-methyltransferase [Fusobacteria bacterium]|nr:16S rRNA (uracil(1498)-N(3))-methyltransferase [Fusobacteriota bacterium]
MLTVIINREDLNDNILNLRDLNEINHMKNVYRMRENDLFRAIDGESEYLFKIKKIENRLIIGELIEKNEDYYSKKTKVDIAIGILKSDKMDLVVQKLTELGINKIIPLITKRNVVKIDKKKDKWDKVSKEALKQCRGVKFIEISDPKSVTEIEYNKYSKVIVFYENEEEKEIGKISSNNDRILYIIGAEGGFDKSEIEYFIKEGASIVTLGKRILRAETAAIVAGGIILNEVH